MTKIWLTQNCNTARCRNPFLVQAWKNIKFPFNGKLLFFLLCSCRIVFLVWVWLQRRRAYSRAACTLISSFSLPSISLCGDIKNGSGFLFILKSLPFIFLFVYLLYGGFIPRQSFLYRLWIIRYAPLAGLSVSNMIVDDYQPFTQGWWWSVDWACTILAKHCCAWIQIPCHSPCS